MKPPMKKEWAEHFWSLVEKSEKQECWIWNGPLAGPVLRAYFNKKIGGKKYSYIAARFCYFLIHGFDPKGLCVCHSCDNTLCVNPKHLWLGTQKDNMRDCLKKGRQGKKCEKLTPNDVREIRQLYAKGGISQEKLANKYGVSRRAIGFAIRKETWAHV